jgi:hypothetical protein
MEAHQERMDTRRKKTAACREMTETCLESKELTPVEMANVANGVTTKTTITVPPSIEKFLKQRRWKRKPTDDADKREKKLTASTIGVNDSQLQSKFEVCIENFFAPLRSIEMEADHVEDADGTTERQQEQAPSSRVPL